MATDTKLKQVFPSIQNSPLRAKFERDIYDRDWNHLMGHFFGPSALTKGSIFNDSGEYSDSRAWSPRVDVSEDTNNYYIHAELPGIEKDAINVHVENSLLVIEGERHHESESKTETDERSYHRVERSYGSFNRAFRLPRSVDSAKIAAKFTNGVLELTVPKAEEAKPKAIDIKVK